MANIWRNWNPCEQLKGMEHGLPARENRMGVSQKNIVTI